MLARFRPRFNHATVVAYLALFVALGGGALAATGFIGTDGRIHGCVVSKTGQLTVVKPDRKCNKSQIAIAWNQRGPRGRTGPQGLMGLQGLKGEQGTQGQPGPTFAAASTTNSPSTPPASPDESSSVATSYGRSFSFTLPAAGKIYVRFFSPSLGRSCSLGGAYAGFYLDGAPVSASDHVIDSYAGARPTEFVAVTPASAGAHTVQLREDCLYGTLGSNQDDVNPTWTILLVGS